MLIYKKLMAITIACFIFAGVKSSFAEQTIEKHSFDLKPNSFYLNYNASEQIKTLGQMYGIGGSYTFTHKYFALKAEGWFDAGSLDYSSSDSERLNNTFSMLWEYRILGGYLLPVSETSFIISYIGFGYRELEHSYLEKKFASVDGDVGYSKNTEYYYIPIVINFRKKLNNGWFFKAAAEYDWLLWGETHYKLTSYAGNGYIIDEVNSKQKRGYGLRGSINLQKKLIKFLSLGVEPFIRYWKIAESEPANISYYKGIKVGEEREPRNYTTEVGINLILKFQLPPSE